MIVRLLKRPTRFHPPASPAHQALSAPRGVRRLTVARKARGNSRQSQRPGRTFSGSGRIRFLSTKYVLSRSSAPLSAAAQTAKVDAKPGVPSQRICFRRPASEQALIMPCRMPLQLCSLLRKKVCSLTSAQPRGRTAAPGAFSRSLESGQSCALHAQATLEQPCSHKTAPVGLKGILERTAVLSTGAYEQQQQRYQNKKRPAARAGFLSIVRLRSSYAGLSQQNRSLEPLDDPTAAADASLADRARLGDGGENPRGFAQSRRGKAVAVFARAGCSYVTRAKKSASLAAPSNRPPNRLLPPDNRLRRAGRWPDACPIPRQADPGG